MNPAVVILLVPVFWRATHSLAYMPGVEFLGSVRLSLSLALVDAATLLPKVALLLSAPLSSLGEFNFLYIVTLTLASSFNFSHLGRGGMYHFEFSW